ncbi:hypothetical protein [Paludisphaera soli]|uniref:hypothetical protein n=1 Tax=Paludisphaera soli TaxID=2712865 RepID=UPI0013EB433B|nr:hypothetical protein [Paludisphaera soli]
MRRWRFSTLILLVVIFALAFALAAQQRREARLRMALDVYRDRGQEKILDQLDRPLALDYPEDTPLEVVLKQIKTRTAGAIRPGGMPIYVDPIGLSEADATMRSPVKRPTPEDEPTLGEDLRRILDPLGLAWKAEGGFLMITSKESLDQEKAADDPYLKYRDALK